MNDQKQIHTHIVIQSEIYDEILFVLENREPRSMRYLLNKLEAAEISGITKKIMMVPKENEEKPSEETISDKEKNK